MKVRLAVEQKNREKKKCFIITPIGEDDAPIRRHIEGLIDAAIEPAIGETFELIVAHRVSIPGSINKQIITDIFNSDLVIANLTDLNPNVVYELAFSHSIRKPVITIMEKGSRLPFDLSPERTIFYTNDFKGVLELKLEIKQVVESIISLNIDEIDNPIYSALKGMLEEKHVFNNIKDNVDANFFNYIKNRLDNIEENLITEKNRVIIKNSIDTDRLFRIRVSFNENKDITEDDKYTIALELRKRLSQAILMGEIFKCQVTSYGIYMELFNIVSNSEMRNCVKVNTERILSENEMRNIHFTVAILESR